MPEIVALLQTLAPLLEKTTLRQLSQVVFGMLVVSGRITMLGLSRWTEAGGSYRTIQRLYHTVIDWKAIHWLFFRKRFLKEKGEYILAGDEVVVPKAGQETHGIARFFAGLQQQVIPAVSFFAFSLVNVEDEQSYPIEINQIVKEKADKAASKAQPAAPQVKQPTEKRKPGRPKGSKNKPKTDMVLSAELLRIQTNLRSVLKTIGSTLKIRYVALDGHFGNYPSAYMIRQENLHLISKLRSDAALYLMFAGEHPGPGPKPKYGPKLEVRKLDVKYLKKTTTDEKNKERTDFYQGQFYNKEFAFALNVVILLKTNLETNAQSHAILFSTDLELEYEKLIDLYSLRFQIEFNFRDAKQYWGLDDFMNVKETAVTNAANLAFLMVNLSQVFLLPFRETQPDFSILDLKAHFRGIRYASETIKMLPQKPDAILLAAIFEQIARLGAIHPLVPPSTGP